MRVAAVTGVRAVIIHSRASWSCRLHQLRSEWSSRTPSTIPNAFPSEHRRKRRDSARLHSGPLVDPSSLLMQAAGAAGAGVFLLRHFLGSSTSACLICVHLSALLARKPATAAGKRWTDVIGCSLTCSFKVEGLKHRFCSHCFAVLKLSILSDVMTPRLTYSRCNWCCHKVSNFVVLMGNA